VVTLELNGLGRTRSDLALVVGAFLEQLGCVMGDRVGVLMMAPWEMRRRDTIGGDAHIRALREWDRAGQSLVRARCLELALAGGGNSRGWGGGGRREILRGIRTLRKRIRSAKRRKFEIAY